MLEGLKDIKDIAKTNSNTTEQLRVATVANQAHLAEISALREAQERDRLALDEQSRKIDALLQLVQTQVANATASTGGDREVLEIANSFLTDLQEIELPAISTPSGSRGPLEPTHPHYNITDSLRRAAPTTHSYLDSAQESPIVARNVPTGTHDRTVSLSTALSSVQLGAERSKRHEIPPQPFATNTSGSTADEPIIDNSATIADRDASNV